MLMILGLSSEGLFARSAVAACAAHAVRHAMIDVTPLASSARFPKPLSQLPGLALPRGQIPTVLLVFISRHNPPKGRPLKENARLAFASNTAKWTIGGFMQR